MSKQYAMVVEVDRCIGCFGCQVACKFENDVALGTSRCHTYTMGPVGDFPHLSMYFLTVQCQQCENPSCTEVCPTGACYNREQLRAPSSDSSIWAICSSESASNPH